jgi:hypothetical protein
VPEIDVTDVLLDPDIAGEQLTVLRRVQTIGTNGVAVITETAVMPAPVGSVRPTGDNSLVREEAYQQQAKSIRVVTNFMLRGEARDGGVDYQPDVIVWKGSRFVVRTIEDYSQYGAGMIQADCTSMEFDDPPPT